MNQAAEFSWNVISDEVWNTMEYYGAVFLPASGRRNGVSVAEQGSKGRYWLATGSNSQGYAYYVSFEKTSLNSNTTGRGIGFSVRLVRRVE